MKFPLSAAVLCLAILAVARADEENPFKKAQVGDWAEYDLTTNANNVKLTGKMKLIVAAKKEKDNTATVRTTVTIITPPAEKGGKPVEQTVSTQDATIDLTKPFDPTSTSGLPAIAEAKVEKTETATEKLTIGGKTYECTMTKMKLSAKVLGQDVTSEVKVWTSKDVPLAGMVKMEMKSNLADMTMEFKEAGSKPPPAAK